MKESTNHASLNSSYFHPTKHVWRLSFWLVAIILVIFSVTLMGLFSSYGPYDRLALWVLVGLAACSPLAFFLYFFHKDYTSLGDAPQQTVDIVQQAHCLIGQTLSEESEKGFILTNLAGDISYKNPFCQTLFQLVNEANFYTIWAKLGGDESSLYHLKAMALAGEVNEKTFQPLKNGKTPYTLSARTVGSPNHPLLLWQIKNIKPLTKTQVLTVDAKELSLAQGERAFLDYFVESPFALALIDTNGNLVKTNKIFAGLSGKVALKEGTSLHAQIIEDDQAAFEQGLLQCMENRKHDIIFDARFSKAADHYIRFHFTPFNTGADKLIILSAQEITQTKALEDKMAQSQKMQAVGQLAGGIAHDFNNVLTAILMSCDLLLSSHRSSDPAHADLMNIKNNANRAAALVQQLLAFSRRQTLRPEAIDLTELLSDCYPLLLPLLGNKATLKIIHGRDLWPVEVDQDSIQRVVMNLVINARDAIPLEGEADETGAITITTKNISIEESRNYPYPDLRPGNYVELSVHDNGTGIAKDVQEKMFEPFFTTKEVGKGTGLGLSMVYGIIKQTGGAIYCESAEGEGTNFRIFLPRLQRNDALQTQQSLPKENNTKVHAESARDLTGSATILLVEDEAAVRMGEVRALQSRGYKVLEASTGAEALEIFIQRRKEIDLVVSDVVMPEMDGPSLLRALRAHDPAIKFIFVSGYAKDAFAKNLPEDADFGFLSKPFSLKDLAIAVKDMLS